MKYDFQNVTNRQGASSSKTSASLVKEVLGLNYYDDTISMWIADMDFVVAPPIVDAVKRRADVATFGYSLISEEYFEAVNSWFAQRHQMSFSNSDILFSAGTVPAIRSVVRALTLRGEGVIIQPPVYYPFGRVTAENGRKVVENHLIVDENNSYTVDFEDFEAKCADPNNKLFIFCNPHNPIGQIWSRDVAQRLLDICTKHDVLFLSDEVHADIIRSDARFTSSLNLDRSEGIIVATAVNKTFNLAGLHITNLIIKNEGLRSKLDAYVGGAHISPFAEAATIAAYRECGEWVDQMNGVLDDNLSYMKQFIGERMPKVRFNLPEATYLTWLDLRAYGVAEQDLLRICADRGHLILEAGSLFGAAGEGFVRVNIACPKSLLIEALERLCAVLGEL